MRTITDITGQEWILNFTVGSVQIIADRLKKRLNIDFMAPTAFIARLADPLTACNILAVCCVDQMTAVGISTAEEFAERWAGVKLYDAINELRQEYIDFFPDPTAQAAMSRVVEETEKIQRQAWGLLSENLTKELDRAYKNYCSELRSLRDQPG